MEKQVDYRKIIQKLVRLLTRGTCTCQDIEKIIEEHQQDYRVTCWNSDKTIQKFVRLLTRVQRSIDKNMLSYYMNILKNKVKNS